MEALINKFEHDHSASRGKMAARKLIVFEHETSFGNGPSHILFDKIKVKNINSLPEALMIIKYLLIKIL